MSYGDGRSKLAIPSLGVVQPHETMPLHSRSFPFDDDASGGLYPVDERGAHVSLSQEFDVLYPSLSQERQTLKANGPADESSPALGAEQPTAGMTNQGPPPSANIVATGAGPSSLSLAEHPRQNLEAADLLGHWGHRRVQSVVEGLSLGTAAPETDGADLKRLRAAAQAREGKPLAPNLQAGDEVRLLGSRRGVAYGRWTGGPADTLSIEFDLSRAGSAMRGDPAFSAMLERAGKAWSRRIGDTWPTWERSPGDFKGWLINGDNPDIEVRIGAEGETSSRLEIDVKDEALLEDVAGWANSSGNQAPGSSWEPRFGSIEIDRAHLEEASERHLFATLAHEIGHVVGAWTPSSSSPFIDTEAGTWTGPSVVAVHGRPAPFQDDADPFAWVDGGRSPQATEFDFAHSGVCSSLMAYCSSNDPQPAFLPHAIDFAFLADLGMTVTDETARPETYGLAGWTDHAGFSLSVSRNLRIDLSDRPSRDGYPYPTELDVTDLLEVRVDVFGHRSGGDLHQSYPAEGAEGTVRYAGGLLGAAIDRTGLPPVTGDSSLAVNLGSLDGTASFTSLQVYARGSPEVFSGGSLHYPFELSAGAIVGTETGSALRADFYGPGHESVAGALHDPGAGLLASFGAVRDDRPSREDVIAYADRLLGRSYRTGAADPTAHGWSQYRCATASACESRHAGPDGWDDWTTATRSEALAATAGWTWRYGERPDADRDVVRIARYSAESTDGLKGRDVVDGYTGTLEHVAFGTGFERYTNWSPLSNEALPDTGHSFSKWAGVQGTASGTPPEESVKWSGLMLGYQGGRSASETPFVEGLANLEFSLSDHGLDVAFSDVASRDGRRTLRGFGFTGLQVKEDGTFGTDGDEGAMDGAFFGPSQEEAAGAFHHNASNITGGFGARRLPEIATLDESGPSGSRPPLVDLDDTRHVGGDVAPALDRLTAANDYGVVAVSSGQVQDGAGAERVLAYLDRHVGADYKNWSPLSGLATFPGRPVVRLAKGTSDELAAYVEHSVQLINTALPYGKRIVFSSDPAPPLAAIEDVPEGEIFVDFAPSVEHWNHGAPVRFPPDYLSFAEVDPISEFNASTQRHEHKGMRAAHIWLNSRVISNAAFVLNADETFWEYKVLDHPVVESDTVEKVYKDDNIVSPIVINIVESLGLFGRIDPIEFPDSVLPGAIVQHLPNIDGEALLAAYTRLEPGAQPGDLSAESLGPWSDTSFHLRGDLDFAGGEAAFGVASRNGLARPWASGSAPLAALENNSALFGTVSWNGALLGMTPLAETVAGHARLAVELSTLDGRLDFTRLERWGAQTAPGKAGTGAAWGDGDLGYLVEVRGNSFHRTGGDEGEVVGAFFGAAHEAMGGVLERSDLAAGFGGLRQIHVSKSN